MSRNKGKDQSGKAAERRKRPSNTTATTEPAKVWPEKLIGAKYVRLLERQLRHLQEEDAHGNRKLFLDVSAKTIALLCQHRWQVELFFRWFKSIGHFGHLISHSNEGALTHLYVTIIVVLLMYLHTGYRPSKYMFALLSQVAAGAATLDEIMPILRERERRKELGRASAARRRAKKEAESQ